MENFVEDAKQFAGFSQRRADFGNFRIKFAQKQQPVFAFGRFFRDNGESVFLISIFEQLFYS